MKLRRLIPALTLALLGSTARAGLLLESDLGYGLSSLKTTSSASSSELYTGFFAGATISKKPYYLIGFRFNNISQRMSVGSSATSASASSMEWGPQLGVMFGKGGIWHFDVAYIVHAAGSIKENGSTLGTFSGTGYQVGLGCAPIVKKSFFLGFKVIYHSFKASKLVDTSSVSSTVSYSGTYFMPSVFMGIKFGH